MEASEQYRLLMADVYELAGLSRRTSEAIARELGQTVARWHVLSVLSAGPCTVPAIARRLGLTRQGVQRVADDLLAARLLQASSNPDHMRSPLLTLTNRGQLVLEQLTQRSDAARGRLLQQAHITAEDLEAARTTLRALLQSLATSDRNFRPGIPATGAELPVNGRMFHVAASAYRSESGSFSATRHTPFRLSQQADHCGWPMSHFVSIDSGHRPSRGSRPVT